LNEHILVSALLDEHILVSALLDKRFKHVIADDD